MSPHIDTAARVRELRAYKSKSTLVLAKLPNDLVADLLEEAIAKGCSLFELAAEVLTQHCVRRRAKLPAAA